MVIFAALLCFEENVNYNGYKVSSIKGPMTAEQCQGHCQQEPQCHHFRMMKDTGDCELKKEGADAVREMSDNRICGPKFCPTNEEMGIINKYST